MYTKEGEVLEAAEQINVLDEEIILTIFDLEDEVSRERVRQIYRAEAKRQGKTKEFDALYKAYKKDNKEVNKYRVTTWENQTKAMNNDYLYINNRGNLSVNTSLLAEHIRTTSHYHIVKKQGADSFFIYWYEDGYYKEISPNELKAKIKEFIPLDIRKPSFWEDTYKDLVSTDVFISYSDMNNEEEFINFKNGLLSTKTWQFIEHSPEHKHTIQLKCNYNPSAKTPVEWLKFIDTLTEGDQQLKDTLQEWMGLNISNYNANVCKKSLALYGDVGNTGKSKYLNIISLIVGLDNVCGVSIQDLSARFGTGALYGTKCVLIDDQKATNIEDGSSFKTITGCGPVQVELKGKQPFTMVYRGGITMTCNAMPYIKDDKGSHMFDRFLIIPCNNVVPVEKRDKLLLEKLKLELEGIVMWALEGLKRLLENNFMLTEGEVSREANDRYRAMNDSFFRFISECYDISSNKEARIKKTELEADYIKYCNENGITPLEKKNIIDRASANGIQCKKTNGIFHYIGITEKLPF